MDIIRFLKNYYIPFHTEGKNIQQGWIEICCPLCHDHSTHGGFNLTSKELYYHCWRCGWHPLEEVVAKLANVQRYEAKHLITVYSGVSILPEIVLEQKPLIIPGGALLQIHKEYLIKRRFDPDYVVKKYNIKGTGPVGDFKLRLIFPITYEKIEVSYHSRDITELSRLKTKACPKEQEIIPHKHIFYGLDFIRDTLVLVEGIFDAWRIGDGALATFGASSSIQQLQLLNLIKPKRVFVMFDADAAGQINSKKLSVKLSGLGIETYEINLHTGDPDNLPENEVKILRKELRL